MKPQRDIFFAGTAAGKLFRNEGTTDRPEPNPSELFPERLYGSLSMRSKPTATPADLNSNNSKADKEG